MIGTEGQPPQDAGQQGVPQGAPPAAPQPAQQDYSDLPQSMGIDRDKRIPDKLHEYMRSKNIAELLDDKKLEQIGKAVRTNTEIDDNSRSEWKKIIEEAVDVVKMTQEEKSWPWPKAANVKHPLVLNAQVQFNARVLPQYIKGDQVVMFDVMRPDPTNEETERAERMGKHMSYQLVGGGGEWMRDKDKMLMVLAFSGNAFTKTYRDHIRNRNVTEFCQPEDIIINQNVKSLESAQRITHRMEKDVNFIIARQNAGEYLKIPLSDLRVDNSNDDSSEYGEGTLQFNENTVAVENYEDSEVDYTSIHVLEEQNCWMDLDGDGYQEPYTVIIQKESEKVFRIVARYDESSFVFSKEKDTMDKFIEIIPIEYFTHYIFLPSYDGGFYGIGFAHILAPMNITINGLINKLMDAGTLSNLQSGFLGKGLRMRKGDVRLIPGEWKQVDNAPGTSIKDNVVPLPTKEPSAVLFQLLGMLVEAGEKISSVSDVMQGQAPAAGTPATTVINLIQQGTKVFSAVLMRLYYSLKSEYEKNYELNKKYLTESQYYRSALGSGMIEAGDYQNDSYGVLPVADPNLSVDTQVLMKAQALYQAKDDPNIDSREATLRLLEAIKIPNIKKAMAPPPDPNAPPPPEVQAELDNKNADTANKLAQVHEMAENAHLEETKVMISALVEGANVTKMKIDSGLSIAESESTLGVQATQKGMQEEQQLEQGGQIEQLVEQMAEQEAMQQGQQGEPQQQGEGGGAQPAEGPAEQPGPGGPEGPGNLPPAAQQALEGAGGAQEKGAPGNLGATIGVGGKPTE